MARSCALARLLPYGRVTDGWFDAARLAAMERGAMLVSCGSGSVIDEAALAAALPDRPVLRRRRVRDRGCRGASTRMEGW